MDVEQRRKQILGTVRTIAIAAMELQPGERQSRANSPRTKAINIQCLIKLGKTPANPSKPATSSLPRQRSQVRIVSGAPIFSRAWLSWPGLPRGPWKRCGGKP